MEKQSLNTFTKDFKLIAVKMRLEQHKTYRSIAKELKLPNQSYVCKWVEKYKKYGEEGLINNRGHNKKVTKKPKPLSVEEENLRLRAENDYLKKLLLVGRRDTPKE